MMTKSKLALVAILLGTLCVACGRRSPLAPGGVAGSGGQTSAAAGQTGAAGAQPDASGAAGATGAGGTIAILDGGNEAAPGVDGRGDAAADGGVPAILEVAPTLGCGHDPGQALGTLVRGTIQTMGIKAPDCADMSCGAWSYLREYYVQLPMDYDRNKAYPILFEGPGCGGKGNNLYALPDLADQVIRVGLSPPPNDIGHATNPGQGCFDESEGDDSVEWPFFENLYDQLATQVCFDRNRVFTVGNASGGGRFADELACKYAGDATRPIRGVMSNSGDWSTNPKFLPTCTNKPMAGMWIHEIGDATRPFASTKLAIARAMKVDGCTIGTGFDDAQFDRFPIGGGNLDTTCKKIRGCPALFPLVVCAILGNQHSTNPDVANPGFSTFVERLEDPPLTHDLSCGFPMPNPAWSGLPNLAGYAANADGTVTDEVTGLTWEGAANPGSFTQSQAATFCAAKGEGWRLPNRIELVSLLGCTVSGPSADQMLFTNTPGGNFWTSSSAAADPGSAWAVSSDFSLVKVAKNAPSSTHVRCVRGAVAACSPTRYDVQAGLVLDRATGLTWQQVADTGSYSWFGALTYCDGLGMGWRLPSVNELLTIVDDTTSAPAIDATAFPNTPAAVFWASSYGTITAAMSVDFRDGHWGGTASDAPGLARCVRWADTF